MGTPFYHACPGKEFIEMSVLKRSCWDFSDKHFKFKHLQIWPKKINYMFLRHRPRHFQPPRIKNFYCISSIHI